MTEIWTWICSVTWNQHREWDVPRPLFWGKGVTKKKERRKKEKKDTQKLKFILKDLLYFQNLEFKYQVVVQILPNRHITRHIRQCKRFNGLRIVD